VDAFGRREIDEQWGANRIEAMGLLTREAELEEIVRLVGVDALSTTDRLTMQIAKIIREDFLHQNAFHEVDTYTSLGKQFLMLEVILEYYHRVREAVAAGANFDELIALPVLEQIARAKYVTEEDGVPAEAFAKLKQEVADQVAGQVPAGKD